jgi:hypothetical protein
MIDNTMAKRKKMTKGYNNLPKNKNKIKYRATQTTLKTGVIWYFEPLKNQPGGQYTI